MIILCGTFVVILFYAMWRGCQTLQKLEAGETPTLVFCTVYSAIMSIGLVGVMFTSPYAKWPLLAALPTTVGFLILLASSVWMGLIMQQTSYRDPFPARQFGIYLVIFLAGMGISASASLI